MVIRHIRREVIIIDRHYIHAVPLQSLHHVHRRHHHLTAVPLRVKARIVRREADKALFVFRDHRQFMRKRQIRRFVSDSPIASSFYTTSFITAISIASLFL